MTAVPFAPEKRIEVVLGEAVDRGRHLTLERIATHLPIGDDFEADAFLQCDNLVDGTIFRRLELVMLDAAFFKRALRV